MLYFQCSAVLNQTFSKAHNGNGDLYNGEWRFISLGSIILHCQLKNFPFETNFFKNPYRISTLKLFVIFHSLHAVMPDSIRHLTFCSELFQMLIVLFIYEVDCKLQRLSHFVMLSLAKHCCRSLSSFIFHSLKDVFPPFLLKEKVEPKVQGKPERSARFALPTHSNTPLLSTSIL